MAEPSKPKAAASGASRSSSVKSPKPASKDQYGEELGRIKAALSNSSNLNPIADLIILIQKDAANLPSQAVVPSLSLLVQSLAHLLSSGAISLDSSTISHGLLSTQSSDATLSEADQQVQHWLRERYNEAIRLLIDLMLTHSKEKSRVACLNGLMKVQKATCDAICHSPATLAWSDSPWALIVNAVVLGQYQSTDGEIRTVEVCPEVRATFILDYVEKFVDVKLALYKTLQSQLRASSASRSDVLSILMHLTNPPATKEAIRKGDFFVAALATPPPRQAHAVARSNTRQRGARIREDGDDSELEGEGEEEDLAWFSDSEDEETPKEGARSRPLNRTQDSGPSVTGPKAKRRRRGAGNLPFHQALHDIKAWNVTLDGIWLRLILHRSPKSDLQGSQPTTREAQTDGGLSLGEINGMLRVMEKKILPYLSKPQLVADWLIDCLDVGGSTALLSLSPLYTLYVSHSLSLPSLYSTLYGLLTPALLHSPHRSHSLRLLALFLSSQKLPLAIILAFVKRLSRCALRGPPGGVIPVTIMIYNLLKTHKDGMSVLHQDHTDVGGQGWIDPYESSLDLPPSSTKAQHSSLFEVSTLGASSPSSFTSSAAAADGQERLESHYHAPTTTIVRILSQPFTKESYNLEEFLDHSFGSLIETEVARTLKAGGLKKRVREPAVRFSLAEPDGKRVRVFPTQGEAPRSESRSMNEEGEKGMPVISHLGDEEGVEGEVLDEEEVEAREAMREVVRMEAEEKEKERREAKERLTSRGLSLWSY